MPVFNRPELTQLSIIHINKLSKSVPFYFTVVDNGSDSNLQKKLINFAENKFIDKLYLLDRNIGISGACNIGWRSCESKYFLKIDNDIIIKDINFIEKIIEISKVIGVPSVLGPALLDSMIENSSKIIQTKYGRIALCSANVPGGALLIPRIIYLVVGMFNEDYGLYGADDGDYGLRINTTRFVQYFYENKNYFDHKGKWDSSEYDDMGLNKESEHKKLFYDNGIGLLKLNSYLFNSHIRNIKIPFRYNIIKKDRYHYITYERHDYKKIKSALQISKNIIDWSLKNIDVNKNSDNIMITKESFEYLKELWNRCERQNNF